MDRMLALALAFKLKDDGTDGRGCRTVRGDGRGECLGVILLLQVRAIARLPRLPRRTADANDG